MILSFSLQQQQQQQKWIPAILLATALFVHVVCYSKKKKKKRIYLDYNATTPVDPRVYKAMIPFFTHEFGNPSSTNHWAGQIPAAAIHKARQQVLQLLGLVVDTPVTAVWFTASGTEADNWAIALALANSKASVPHIVTSNVEHPAIEQYLYHLQNLGRCRVTFVAVQQEDGRVLVDQVLQAITTNTCLVTLQYANNETGALQPIQPIAAYCRQHNILFHTDAAQAAGKVSMLFHDDDDDDDGPDLVTLVGHKMGAPKGVGCLYVRPGCLEQEISLFWGGGQEFGRRAGTENVPYIVGLGEACALAAVEWKDRAAHMEKMRELLLTLLTNGLGGPSNNNNNNVQPNGPTDPSLRLPNTLSVGLKDVDAGELLKTVGDRVAASAGASCHTNSTKAQVSSVLRAMRVPKEFAQGTIRLSVSQITTKREVEEAAAILIEAVQQQKTFQQNM